VEVKMQEISKLPISRKIGSVYILGIIIAFILLFVSIFSIRYSDTIYGTDIIKPIIDTITLFLILPLLVVSLILSWKEITLGLLSLIGIFFYISYNFFPYFFDIPFGVMFLPHLLLVVLSITGLITLILSMDPGKLKILFSTVPVKFSAGILILLALLVLLFQMIDIISVLSGDTETTSSSTALIVSDLLLGVPIMLFAGISLWRKKGYGYALGGSLLLGYMYLSLGLIPFFFMHSAKTGLDLDTGGLIVIGIMIVLCLVPLSFFARDLSKKKMLHK
jgi:hypothetical protein